MKLRRKALTEVCEHFFALAGAWYIEQQNAQSYGVSDHTETDGSDTLGAMTLSIPEFEIVERNAV